MRNPGAQLSAHIKRQGKSTPVNTILREGIINGVETIKREAYQNGIDTSDTAEIGEIIIKRDEFLTNKLAIINVKGEFFSQEAAENHLNTLADSGNANYHEHSELAENYGQGAKISYLPHAPQGILYRSKRPEDEHHENPGHTFHMKLLNEYDCYGIQSKYCDYYEDIIEFQYCENFNSDLKNSKYAGTEMVLMGANLEEDTWKTMCLECAPKNNSNIVEGVGWSIYKSVSNRFFRNPGVNIKTEINTGDKSYFMKVKPIYETMKNLESYGSIILNNNNGVPIGTKVHYCLKKDYSDSNKHAALPGSVSFAWKKENYYNLEENPQSRAKKLKLCGIWQKPTDWIIIFELPSSYNATPSENRTSLSCIDQYCFFQALYENLPEDITKWLEDQAPKDVNKKDIDSWLTSIFKDYTKDIKVERNKTLKSSSSQKPPSGQKRKKPNSRNPSKKASLDCLKNFESPNIVYSDCDYSPLLEFNFEQYTLFFNKQHPIFIKKLKSFVENDRYRHINETIVSEWLIKHHLKAAISRILDVQKYYGDLSLGERIQKWIPDILEATYTMDCETAVQRTLNRSKALKIA